MPERPHQLAHLGDAALLLVMIIVLAAGADLRLIFVIYLAFEAIGCVFKALAAFVERATHG